MLPYASIADLREVTLRRIKIRFHYCGQTYEVEPHELTTHPRTHAFELVARVIKFPDGGVADWRRFRYCHIRGMECLRASFKPRYWAGTPPMMETRPSRAKR